MDSKGKYKAFYSISYPILVLAMQLLPLWLVAVIAAGLLLPAFFKAAYRPFLLVCAFTVIGYISWKLYVLVVSNFALGTAIEGVVGRFGLIGYLLLFWGWQKINPTKHNYFKVGEYKKTIRMPLIWKGYSEPIWRFLLVFVSIFLVASTAMFIAMSTAGFILAGLAFAFVNAVLEELLWRGFILARLADIVGEVAALVSTSIAFGFYHLSLGFSLWVCVAFAIGGFYFAGATIKSKGIIPSIIMHIFVNIFFVSISLIF